MEYDEIKEQCKQLTANIMDHCNETNEVNLLLQHRSGEAKYFRFSDQMKYPLLHLAIGKRNFPIKILITRWHS